MITIKHVLDAMVRTGPAIRETPVIPYERQRFDGRRIVLKMESLQKTGSFKERGALNKLKLIQESAHVRQIVAASAGNHAQAVALHGVQLGFSVTIYMPRATAMNKIASTKRWGAEICLTGENFDDAMEEAKGACGKQAILVHAYDDEEIIAGQGTVGLEMMKQIPDLSQVVVPVGGGGLCAGIALAIKERMPKCRIVGVQAHNVSRTIADGIAIKNVGVITSPILKKYVDDIVTVTEDEIADAILDLMENSKVLSEGAGAVGIAAIRAEKVRLNDTPTAVVLSGGNIDVNLISRIIEKGLTKTGRMIRMEVVIPDRPGGLKELSSLLAQCQANILQIHHERASSQIPLSDTGTDLTLETRGPEHADEIVSALKKGGYHVAMKT